MTKVTIYRVTAVAEIEVDAGDLNPNSMYASDALLAMEMVRQGEVAFAPADTEYVINPWTTSRHLLGETGPATCSYRMDAETGVAVMGCGKFHRWERSRFCPFCGRPTREEP